MAPLRLEIPLYVLAGGRSSRFGSDKARAMLGQKPLLKHVVDSLAPVASKTTVVASTAGEYRDLGLRTIADRRPGLGPLAGLETALSDCDAEWLLLVSCDLPRARPSWAARLAERRTEGRAVAFRDEHWHPLFALYRRSLLSEVGAALDAGRLSLQSLLDAHGVAVQPPEDFAQTAGINTPDDLEEWTS